MTTLRIQVGGSHLDQPAFRRGVFIDDLGHFHGFVIDLDYLPGDGRLQIAAAVFSLYDGKGFIFDEILAFLGQADAVDLAQLFLEIIRQAEGGMNIIIHSDPDMVPTETHLADGPHPNS